MPEKKKKKGFENVKMELSWNAISETSAKVEKKNHIIEENVDSYSILHYNRVQNFNPGRGGGG